MRIVAITQARIGSTRLPGKVLCDIIGEPMLAHHVNRAKRSRSIDDIVVATSTADGDDAIVKLCENRGWLCFRGSEQDVLDRYYRAAVSNNADVIVRITSDCPLIDPEIIDSAVNKFVTNHAEIDYVSNGLPKCTFPRGLDVEVIGFSALERAWHEDDNMSWREHVTPHIINNGGSFHMEGISHDPDLSHMRWTVDTSEDLDFVRRIYEHFGHDRFGWEDVLRVLDENPHWAEINGHVLQKTPLNSRKGVF